MKNKLFLLTSTLVVIFLVAGCSNDNSSTKKSKQNFKTEQNKSINIKTGDNSTAKTKSVSNNKISNTNTNTNDSVQNDSQNSNQPKDGTPGPQGSNSVYENGKLVNGSPNNVTTNENDESNTDPSSEINKSKLDIPYGQPGHIPTTQDPDYKGVLTTP